MLFSECSLHSLTNIFRHVFIEKGLKHNNRVGKALNLSLIRQKGESHNGCFKKTKHVKFSEKTNISYPLTRTRANISYSLICTCAYQGGGVRNVRFFGKFDVLCFLGTPALIFALLPYYLRITVTILNRSEKKGSVVL